jgi:hypothetical protein
MSVFDEIAAYLRTPDARPVQEIENEILDELQFHLDMRTGDNLRSGMSPEEARADARSRFGDFHRIRRACRRTLLGERIMLQRIQTALTIVLLAAVVFLGLQFYYWQAAQKTAMAHLLQTLDRIAENAPEEKQKALLEAIADVKPPVVVRTSPETGAADVDPSLKEIRVTFSKKMTDQNWSWSQTSEGAYPESAGAIHYLADGRTCVMPVKLRPGTTYMIWLNSSQFQNFCDLQGRPAVPYLLKFQTRKQSRTR